MENTQTPAKQDLESPVRICNIWETIQGEGPFAGRPAVFIRTAGCNLTCPLCDTDYTSNAHSMELVNIVEHVKRIRSSGLVVITGGEPFRQDISSLVEQLVKVEHYTVQIETNGTMYVPGFNHSLATIVCCPKTPKINKELVPFIDAWKYIVRVGAVDELDGLPLEGLGYPFAPARPWAYNCHVDPEIYVQPMDEGCPEKNEANLQLAIQITMEHDYILSLQTHKIMGLA